MKIRLSLPLFLSASEHNYNVALRLYGPPAMAGSDIIPVLPHNAVTETNRETLVQLKHDLAWISDNALSAGDAYCMLSHDEQGRPFWGYLVESARVDSTKEILVLMRSDEGRTRATALRWMPMEKVYTRKQAHLCVRTCCFLFSQLTGQRNENDRHFPSWRWFRFLRSQSTDCGIGTYIYENYMCGFIRHRRIDWFRDHNPAVRPH